MTKESKQFELIPLVIVSAKTVFGKEGFALTKFGSDIQEIFIKRKEAHELARKDGAISGELKVSLENEIEKMCKGLGIPRQDNILDILERQFLTIAQNRQDAAVHSIGNGKSHSR